MTHNKPLVEIWGGVECTVVRINNEVHDQLNINGHERRPGDLNLFSDLGIKKIRYPLLWEKYARDKNLFFHVHDERLKTLRELDITPIAGLVHHGSGPAFTDLSDPDFPELLAEYAYTVARRYPWLELFTPVNEPLTTARFSGLYGIWYPHKKDDASFVRMFFYEMKGIILSLSAVKTINPEAKLIQTEDLCMIHSTELLKYQADFENNRRWLTYDFLTGNFKPGHPLWDFFIRSGITEKELEFFQRNKLRPTVCGFNYYVTSERYLDENLELYPERFHGGNGIHRYADVEVVRVGHKAPAGFYGLLKEAWERYKLPLALTEVHIACTREEQMRWFNEAYHTAIRLKEEGVDFRAITAWAFLGSFDWNSLLRRKNNHYESGIFDLRSGEPRATALASMIRTLNEGKSFNSNLLEFPGWWKRNIRSIYISDKFERLNIEAHKNYNHISPLLIVGANGSLGKAFAKICSTRGIICHLVNRSQLDITSPDSIEKILEQHNPWAVINAAGFSKIDEAEKSPHVCFRDNTLGPSVLAEKCREKNVKLVTFSSDQVFNGKKGNPYTENDATSPLNIYGESKMKAEEKVMTINPDSLIIRSSSFFNPWNSSDALAGILRTSFHLNHPSYVASDLRFSPTYIPDLVNTTLDLTIDNESGIWHLSSQDEISFYEFTKMVLDLAGVSSKNLISVPSVELYAAKRPAYSVLMSSRGVSLTPLEVSILSYLNELPANWRDKNSDTLQSD